MTEVKVIPAAAKDLDKEEDLDKHLLHYSAYQAQDVKSKFDPRKLTPTIKVASMCELSNRKFENFFYNLQ